MGRFPLSAKWVGDLGRGRREGKMVRNRKLLDINGIGLIRILF
jgi:hypothetical protein